MSFFLQRIIVYNPQIEKVKKSNQSVQCLSKINALLGSRKAKYEPDQKRHKRTPSLNWGGKNPKNEVEKFGTSWKLVEQLSKNSSFVSIKHWLAKCWWRGGVEGFGGEEAMVLVVLVEVVLVEVVVGKKWRQKLQKLTLCTYSCRWCGERVKGPKVSNKENSKSKYLSKKNSSQKKKNTQNKTPSDILSTFL